MPALLPNIDPDGLLEYSVVFTLPPARADAVMGLDDDAFVAALQAQFGQRMRFAKPGKRSRFPLALRMRDTLVKGSEVWIGNTAQTLHPVSGQGFNLGMRDVHELLAALKAKLANFKIPKRCFVVAELPRNTMGKVQKNLLREQHKGLFA